MSDQKINIQIAATGGEKAAVEIRKTEQALSGTTAELKELGASASAASKQAVQLDEDVSNIARVQKAQAIATLAEQAGKLAGGFREAADEVEQFDKDAAVALRDTARHIDDVTNSISTVAAGYATGGPLGSAVAALGVLVQSLAQKFSQTEIAAIKSAAAEKAALEKTATVTREAATAARERETAVASAKVLHAMDAELTKAREITSEYQKQINLARAKRDLEDEKLTAKDQADKEQITLDEASGKITPDEAAQRRDEIDSNARRRDRGERKRQALEDHQVSLIDGVNKTVAAGDARAASNRMAAQRDEAGTAAQKLEEYVTGELKKMVRNPKTGEYSDADQKWSAEMSAELERAKNLVAKLSEAAQKAADVATKAEADAKAARSAAADKGALATATSASLNVTQTEDDRSVRIRQQTRQTVANRKAAEERQRNDLESRETAFSESSTVTGTNFKNASTHVGGALRKSFADIGGKLSDGTSEAEIAKLQEDFAAATRGLGGATIEAMRAMLKAQQEQAKEIAQLKRKIKLQ